MGVCGRGRGSCGGGPAGPLVTKTLVTKAPLVTDAEEHRPARDAKIFGNDSAPRLAAGRGAEGVQDCVGDEVLLRGFPQFQQSGDLAALS